MKRTEHQRLLLPYDPPPPATIGGRLPSIPQLWERAKVYFARVINHIGSTASFSQRWCITRSQKKELLGWLEPVEKLARGCLLVRALGFLIMTPEGQRLRRETPKMAMPQPKPPAARPNLNSTKIPMPGWHTIAQNQRALAEQRKRDEEKAAEDNARRHDPASWGGGFRIVGWSLPEPEDGKRAIPAAFRKPRRPWIEILEPNPWPAPAPVSTKPAREKDPAGLILARRIEALARVIANPEPAVMRLARFLARLPRAALEGMTETTAVPRQHWLHGWDDPRSSAAHVRRAAAIYCYIEPG